MCETQCQSAAKIPSPSSRVYKPTELQKFSVGERVKIWSRQSGDALMATFSVITYIELCYDGTITYNGHDSAYIEKCTQDEIDMYFRV